MRRQIPAAVSLGLAAILLGVASCGGSTARRGPSGTVPTSTPPPGPTAGAPATVTTRVTVSPDQGAAGTTLTFTVEIAGRGTLSGEGVMFGDGTTSGANAGDVRCGTSEPFTHTSRYTHAYTRPGTYQFSDRVTALSPPPSCAPRSTTARLTVIVAAPLESATLNGAFVSPTKNIGCYINPGPPGFVRCATFSPPRLVTMDPLGSTQTCSGNQCDLGNPAMETPVLPYGSATAGGPFQCLSAEEGVTCTIVGHKGFLLSRSGVVTVG